MDEYILPSNGSSIPDILRRYQDNTSIGAIQLNWYLAHPSSDFVSRRHASFASSELSFMEIFQNCTLYPNHHTKAIVKVPYTIKFNQIHYAELSNFNNSLPPARAINLNGSNWIKGPFVEPDVNDPLLLLHFHIGSLEEHLIKRGRGRADLKLGGYQSLPTHCYESFECTVSEWHCLRTGGTAIYPSKKDFTSNSSNILTVSPLITNCSIGIRKNDELNGGMINDPLLLNIAIASSSNSRRKENITFPLMNSNDSRLPLGKYTATDILLKPNVLKNTNNHTLQLSVNSALLDIIHTILFTNRSSVVN